LHDQDDYLFFEHLKLLWILQDFIIINRLIDKPERFHKFFELLSFAFLGTARLARHYIQQVLAQFIGLAASLLTHSVVLSHAFLVLFLIVLYGPAILLRIIVPVPADGSRSEFRVETRIWPVCDDTRLFRSFHAQLDVELLALWVFWSNRPDDPGRVFGVAELVAAVCPDEPLVTTLFDLHVLCHKLLDTLTNPETV
jgi:hypothetical protein